MGGARKTCRSPTSRTPRTLYSAEEWEAWQNSESIDYMGRAKGGKGKGKGGGGKGGKGGGKSEGGGKGKGCKET